MSDIDYAAFARPSPESLVAVRRFGATIFATVTSPAISSVEAPVIDETLRETLMEAPDGLRHLVLDLERVTMVNSTALSVLIMLHTTSKQRDVKFVLTGVSGTVLDVLVTTKMTDVLTVCRTADELERELASCFDQERLTKVR